MKYYTLIFLALIVGCSQPTTNSSTQAAIPSASTAPTGAAVGDTVTTADSKPSAKTATEIARTRRKGYDLFLQAAQDIAKKVHDKDVDQRLAFLKKYGHFEEVLPDQLPKFDPKTAPNFHVYVILDSDQQEWAKKLYSDPLDKAHFNPQNQSMVLLRGENYTPAYRAVQALHETGHARTYMKQHPDVAKKWSDTGLVDPRFYLLDEADQNAFQGKLLWKLGDDTYRSMITSTMGKFIDRYPGSVDAIKHLFDWDPAGTAPRPPNAYPELTLLSQDEWGEMLANSVSSFGTPLTLEEERFRLSLIDTDVEFRLADKYATDPRVTKSWILGYHYGQNAIAKTGR